MTNLWQSLVAYGEQSGIDTAPLGYQVSPLNWQVAICTNGDGPLSASIAHLGTPRRNTKGELTGTYVFPKRTVPDLGRTNDVRPYVPTDTAAYVLGLATKGNGETDHRAAAKHAAYLDLLDAGIAETADSGLLAIRAWLSSTPTLPDDMVADDRIEFTVDGAYVANTPSVASWWAGLVTAAPSDTCTVCGVYGPMTYKLPRVKGVAGTTASATLTSANDDSTEHYGRSRRQNTRICERCAATGIGALNALLGDPSHNLRASAITYVWWMLGDNTNLNLFDALAKPDADTVRWFLNVPQHRKTVPAPNAEIALVGLVGKQGRIAVRSWEQGPATKLIGAVVRWLEAVTEHPPDGTPTDPIGLHDLARAVDRTGATDKNQASDRLLPVLIELAYGQRRVVPPTVLRQVLDRICAEGFGNPHSLTDRSRAALLRLLINPPSTHGEHMATDTEQTAYHLGRMLARYDNVQYRSNKSELAAKSMRSMLAQPAKTFASLTERIQPHLAKKGGHKAIGEIAVEIGTDIPVRFSDTEKAQFCLGFWQEKNTIFTKSDEDEAEPTSETTSGDNQ